LRVEIEKEIKDFVLRIGRKLRNFREDLGLTQKELARMVREETGTRTDQTYIGKIELGIQPPSLKTLYRISKVLSVSPWELLADEKDLIDKPYYQLSVKDRELFEALLDSLLSKKLSGEEKEILAKLVDRFSKGGRK